MLILTQDRSEIVNLERYDQIYIKPTQNFSGEMVYSVIATRSGVESDELEDIILGVFSDIDCAGAILANIATDARDGKRAYIIEKGF